MCLFSPHAIYLHILVDKKTMRHHLYRLLWYTLMVLGYRVSPFPSLSHRASISSYVPIIPLSTGDPNLTMGLASHVTLRGLRSDSCFWVTTFSSGILTLLKVGFFGFFGVFFLHSNASILYYFSFNYWKFSISISWNIVSPFSFFCLPRAPNRGRGMLLLLSSTPLNFSPMLSIFSFSDACWNSPSVKSSSPL